MADHYGQNPRGHDVEKVPYEHDQYSSQSPDPDRNLSDPADDGHSLHRGLTAPQISMIAIGGAIGTGYAEITIPSGA